MALHRIGAIVDGAPCRFIMLTRIVDPVTVELCLGTESTRSHSLAGWFQHQTQYLDHTLRLMMALGLIAPQTRKATCATSRSSGTLGRPRQLLVVEPKEADAYERYAVK